MEDKKNQGEANDQAPQLSEEQQQEILNNELAVVPEAERNEIKKVVKTADIVLLDTHKKKVKSFKARFPSKKFAITEDLVFNKEVYDKALEQWREVKNYRTKIAEPSIKELKAPYVAITKFYNDSFNPVIAELKIIEKPISDFVDKMEALEKEEKEKEARILEQKVNERRDILINEGMVFHNGYFEAGNVDFDIPLITLGEIDLKGMTDPIWEQMLTKVKQTIAQVNVKQKEKEAADKLEADKKEKEAARIKKENEEMAAERIESRTIILTGLGMEPMENPTGFKYDSLKITTEFLGTAAKADWDAEFAKLKTAITELKQKAQKEADEKKLLEDRQNELLALNMVWVPAKQEYSIKGIAISLDYLKTATPGGWEEAIADAKHKIEAAKALEKLKEVRHNELVALGLYTDLKFAGYSYKKSGFDVSGHISKDDDAAWDKYVNEFLKVQIKKIDDAIALQAARLAEISPFLLFGHSVATTELYKLDQADYDKLLADTKAAHKAKVDKDLADAAAEKARKDADALAKSTDEVKWKHFIDSLPEPTEMGSEEYKGYAAKAKELIAQIKAIH